MVDKGAMAEVEDQRHIWLREVRQIAAYELAIGRDAQRVVSRFRDWDSPKDVVFMRRGADCNR